MSIASDNSEQDAFEGVAVEEVEVEGAEGLAKKGVRVKTSGRAFCERRILSWGSRGETRLTTYFH